MAPLRRHYVPYTPRCRRAATATLLPLPRCHRRLNSLRSSGKSARQNVAKKLYGVATSYKCKFSRVMTSPGPAFQECTVGVPRAQFQKNDAILPSDLTPWILTLVYRYVRALSHWAEEQQISWVIDPWWLSVSPWRICITFLWPRSSLKLTGPSSRFEHHLHFASLDTWSVSRYMPLSLLFYSRILSAKTNNKVQIFVENYNFIKS